jgi:hypothetical protein
MVLSLLSGSPRRPGRATRANSGAHHLMKTPPTFRHRAVDPWLNDLYVVGACRQEASPVENAVQRILFKLLSINAIRRALLTR